MQLDHVASIKQCVSKEEKRQRAGMYVLNLLVWFWVLIFILASWGILLLAMLFGWLLRNLLAGYNVRKIQAHGATVSSNQFPEIADAVADVCQRFRIKRIPCVVVISSGETNAFAVKFARK